jgi:hypothetical protein
VPSAAASLLSLLTLICFIMCVRRFFGGGLDGSSHRRYPSEREFELSLG